MKIWLLTTPSGYIIRKFEGTKKEAIKYAQDHYVMYKVVVEKKHK